MQEDTPSRRPARLAPGAANERCPSLANESSNGDGDGDGDGDDDSATLKPEEDGGEGSSDDLFEEEAGAQGPQVG